MLRQNSTTRNHHFSLRKLQAGQPIKEGGDCLIERSPRPVCDTAVIPADVHYSTSPKACFQISWRKSTRTSAVIRDVLCDPPKGLGN